MPDTRYARNGDIWLAYQVWGDGPVDVVMAFGHMTHLEQNQRGQGIGEDPGAHARGSRSERAQGDFLYQSQSGYVRCICGTHAPSGL